MTHHTHDKTLPPGENRKETEASIASSEIPSSRRIQFNSGKILTTPGALEALDANYGLLFDLLLRHLSCDWGDIPAEDAEANREALANGWRILSSYPQPTGARIWIITEADRSVTTVLLPEEY
jgi:hypothetical protein